MAVELGSGFRVAVILFRFVEISLLSLSVNCLVVGDAVTGGGWLLLRYFHFVDISLLSFPSSRAVTRSFISWVVVKSKCKTKMSVVIFNASNF